MADWKRREFHPDRKVIDALQAVIDALRALQNEKITKL